MRALTWTADGAAVVFFTCCSLPILPSLHVECARVCSVAANGVACSELTLMGRRECPPSVRNQFVDLRANVGGWVGLTKAQKRIVYAQRELSSLQRSCSETRSPC